MRVSLNKLFEKTEEVYIVNFKYTNAAIKSSGVDYAMCNVGIHPDGIISVMSRGNKFVIRKMDLHKFTNNLPDTIQNLLLAGKLIPYTKQQQCDRLGRKRVRRETTAHNKTAKKERYRSYHKDIEQGINRLLPDPMWMEKNAIVLKSKMPKEEDIVFQSIRAKYRKHAKRQSPFKINGRMYFADIYIKRISTIIEVDGGYHKARTDKDNQRDKDFLSIGIKTLRIPNESVHDGTYVEYLKLLYN